MTRQALDMETTSKAVIELRFERQSGSSFYNKVYERKQLIIISVVMWTMLLRLRVGFSPT